MLAPGGYTFIATGLPAVISRQGKARQGKARQGQVIVPAEGFCSSEDMTPAWKGSQPAL